MHHQFGIEHHGKILVVIITAIILTVLFVVAPLDGRADNDFCSGLNEEACMRVTRVMNGKPLRPPLVLQAEAGCYLSAIVQEVEKMNKEIHMLQKHVKEIRKRRSRLVEEWKRVTAPMKGL